MKCTTCHNTFVHNEKGDLICVHCQLLWIKGEHLKETAIAFHTTESLIHKSDKLHQCLNCHIPMEHHQYAYSSGIFIEKCPTCGKVFLSFEELLQIQHYFATLDSYDGKIAELSGEIIGVINNINEKYEEEEKKSPFWMKYFG